MIEETKQNPMLSKTERAATKSPVTARKGKARIRQTVWGNWYGYIGTKKVEIFFNDDLSQEANAKKWLAEQQKGKEQS